MQVKETLAPLTSLRFVAAMMIVVGHAHVMFASTLAMLMPLGQGVSFFFVLSGFILGWNYPVLETWEARRGFWLARFARIWPLHLVTCLLWIALVFDFDRSAHFPGWEGLIQLATNLMLLQTWVPIHDWGLSFNGVSWSISVEFFFYALFPFLIVSWGKHWHRLVATQIMLAVVFVAIGAYFSLPAHEDAPGIGLLGLIKFNPLVRVFEFTIGIALSLLIRPVAAAGVPQRLAGTQWLLLELLALAGTTAALLAAGNFSGIGRALGVPSEYYFQVMGLAPLWALLIGLFALSRGPVARLLSLRLAVFLGESSFALYLSHAILIHYLEHYKVQFQSFAALGYIVFWVWALTLAALLFIGVEAPCRKCILLGSNQKNWIMALRKNFCAKEIGALLALVAMVGAMYFLRPSTIVQLGANDVNAFLQSSPEEVAMPQSASFDRRYGIIAIRSTHKTNAGTVEVRVLLEALQTMHVNDMLALHLNDRDGKMMPDHSDKRLDFGRAVIPRGAQWIQKFEVPLASFKCATSFGIAMFSASPPMVLYDGVGGERDWGGRRLILPFSR